MQVVLPLPLVALAALVGCGPKFIESTVVHDIGTFSLNRIAFMPFEEEPEVAGTIRSQSVALGATQILTDQLYRRLIERHIQVVSSLKPETIREDSRIAPPSRVEKALEIGRRLETPAVLIGTVTRFVEREGSAVGIRRPASVGFTIELVNTKNGQILWKASYFETQQSLLEDVTNLRLFFKRRGRWLTATEISAEGMDRILATSPWAGVGKDDDANHPGR